MEIEIVAPAPTGPHGGNQVTAARWAGFLRELGHRVEIVPEWTGAPVDLLVALHAVRSARSVLRFREMRPNHPIVLALTGTDVYGGLSSREAGATLAVSNLLVVLQRLAIDALPPEHRAKARVIHQSVVPYPEPPPKHPNLFEVCVLGHLRAVKDPFRAAAATRLLPPSSRVRVVHAGAALDPGMKETAKRETVENPRYAWTGPVERDVALRILSRCSLFVLSSLSEGGANAVGEAIASGVPVATSAIPGSLGLLGEDWPATFPPGDTAALAALLARAESDPAWLADLRARGDALRPLFLPDRERRAWGELLADLR